MVNSRIGLIKCVSKDHIKKPQVDIHAICVSLPLKYADSMVIHKSKWSDNTHITCQFAFYEQCST